ncbi:MAG TPA: DedA family protein [Thermoleophilaceae bacterium]|jgi:membrane protein DedA with SNARE-associated domain
MTSVVTQLGPLGVFLLMVPESACIPVPSEATLLAAGFAVHQGWMPFWLAVAAATAGNLVGSLIAYGVGRLSARRLAWAEKGLARCDAIFERHGSPAVFLARLMPLARTFVSLPAGRSGIAPGAFVAMTALGCAIWAAAFVLLGLVLGSGWRELSGPLGDALLAVGVLVLLLALRPRRS